MSLEPKTRVYDDIHEEDNVLPLWWLAILFGTVAFGFVYWFVYHTTQSLPQPDEEYRTELAAMTKARAEANPMSDEAFALMLASPENIEAGKQVFATTCASCHGQNAEGLIGPNLTDRYWLYGNKPTDIVRDVTEGFIEKGMPPWGPVLGPEKVRKVTAYVLSLKGKNLPGPRPAQGELIE
jgi:cytochrome c oxidase cbb3-type subunit 3